MRKGRLSSGPVSAKRSNAQLLHPPSIAYFTMEAALDAAMPTYSGGLGVLAGDTLRSAADLGVSMVGVTLLHRKGYFNQKLDESGNQTEEPVTWDPADHLDRMDPLVTVTMEGRPVHMCCWRYQVHGVNGHVVPVYLLDTDVSPNSEWDRGLTQHLYGGDEHYRLSQEFVLGVGGVQMLRQLGHADIETHHMNEGHSALMVLRLLERQLALSGRRLPSEEDLETVRRQCVFTTHTPVPAGHDAFPEELLRRVLGDERTTLLYSTGFTGAANVNMTHLALHHSNYVNGVAMRHGEVSREMFPNYRIKALTNGVHAVTWTAHPMQEVFDREIPEWRHDNIYLRYAKSIPLSAIREAHARSKRALLQAVEESTATALEQDVMTIGFARRATGYKRADLVFSQLERLSKSPRRQGDCRSSSGARRTPETSKAKT